MTFAVPLASVLVILDAPNPNPLYFAILVYGGYYFLGFRLLVQPYLRKTPGGTTRDKELPYLIIPVVLISFLMSSIMIGHVYFETGKFPVGYQLAFPLWLFVWCSACSIYYAVLLPKVFHHNFHTQSLVKPLSPFRAVMFILPVPAAITGGVWFFVAIFFEGFPVSRGFFGIFPVPRGFFEMGVSFTWVSIPAFLFILAFLNRVWLRPYLMQTKGMVSRDDQLPYFVIPTLIAVFSVFLFDVYRYSLGILPFEPLLFSFTLFICSVPLLICLGFVFPRQFNFSFQERTFTKPPLWYVLSGTHTATFVLIAFVTIIVFGLLFST